MKITIFIALLLSFPLCPAYTIPTFAIFRRSRSRRPISRQPAQEISPQASVACLLTFGGFLVPLL